MWLLLHVVLYVYGLLDPTGGCMGTTGGGTTVTTTTVAPTGCGTCTVGQVTFTEGDLGQGTETSTNEEPTTGADGCLSMVVICPATNTGPIFMQFNGAEGGPSDPNGAEVRATLNCVDGNWVFAPVGQESRIITEVNCVAA